MISGKLEGVLGVIHTILSSASFTRNRKAPGQPCPRPELGAAEFYPSRGGHVSLQEVHPTICLPPLLLPWDKTFSWPECPLPLQEPTAPKV